MVNKLNNIDMSKKAKEKKKEARICRNRRRNNGLIPGV